MKLIRIVAILLMVFICLSPKRLFGQNKDTNVEARVTESNSINYGKEEIGLMYEHRTSKNFIFTIKAGGANSIRGRLTSKGEPSSHKIADVSQGTTSHFSFGVSYNIMK